MPPTYKDKIGFLSYEKTIQFSHGWICPVNSFDDACEYVNKNANKDGFFYPPIIETYKQRHDVIEGKLHTFEDLVPKTKRPAHLFKMPASHEIQIIYPSNKSNSKQGDGLFITYLIAFIFGIRLQFHDWWFDGRVPN